MNHILNIPETMVKATAKAKPKKKKNIKKKIKEKKKKRKEYLLNPTIKLLPSKHITKTCL